MPDLSRAQFEQLLHLNLPVAYRLAWRLTSNRDDAEDLLQETSIKAFLSLTSFQANSNFKAWFARILVNTFLNEKRQRARIPHTVSDEVLSEEALYSSAALNDDAWRRDDPPLALLARLDGEAVDAAIAALPIDFRIVASLYFYDDQSYSDIAAILGCPVGTVRSRLHRARHLLRTALREYARELGIAEA
jgi:RNA polymerase sigma-70 factor (ECF subfamily)